MRDFKKGEIYFGLFVLLGLIVIAGGVYFFRNSGNHSEQYETQQKQRENLSQEGNPTELPGNLKEKRTEIVKKYSGRESNEWGEEVSGVVTGIKTEEKIIALTLDACGGGGSSDGYDEELIEFLQKERIPATLFINYRWLEVNQEIFLELAADSLFSIQNHGYQHLPLSVEGRSVYSISGTENPGEVADEVLYNQVKIEELTGQRPRFFRSGTAFYDEVAVEIVNELGAEVIGFNILGDAGATFSREQVKEAFLGVEPGSIILAHMNHPESETAEGIMAAVPELREKGFEFVKLEEYSGQLIAEF